MLATRLFTAAVSCLVAGCVVVRPTNIFLQNTTGQPILARLHYREWVQPTDTVHLRYQTVFAQGLRYAPQLLPPNRKIMEQLPDRLPVSATDTAATFILPPHTTVLLQQTANYQLPLDCRLYLQLAGAPTRVVDRARFLEEGHVRQGGFWYAIND